MATQKNIEALEKEIAKLEKRINEYEQVNQSGFFSNVNTNETFFNKIPIGIVVFEVLNNQDITKNKIIGVNKHFEKISELSKQQLINKNITELIDQRYLPSNMCEGVLKNDKTVEIETSLIGKDKHFHITIFKLSSDSIIAAFNDYTSLKEAEDTILFERTLFQTLLNKWHPGIY